MNVSWPTGIGAVLALVILILVVVFVAIGKLSLLLGLFIGGLAVARLT